LRNTESTCKHAVEAVQFCVENLAIYVISDSIQCHLECQARIDVLLRNLEGLFEKISKDRNAHIQSSCQYCKRNIACIAAVVHFGVSVLVAIVDMVEWNGSGLLKSTSRIILSYAGERKGRVYMSRAE
jgi:hypothetical protein